MFTNGLVFDGVSSELRELDVAVDGNLLHDVSLFDENGTNVLIVMKGGHIYKHAA